MEYRLLATAGHVDHGKTELLKALTGQETDRLDEEKERGLTIDLGFADMRQDDLHIGFVDVPGHHNFIKNMVSGIGSVQGVVFVVSAADGWEAQSREHFEIVRMIQPDYCCFALTKIDLVDDEMRLLAQAEIEDAIADTDYEGADVHPVSSTEPTGIEALRRTLFEDLRERPNPPDYDKPYCPVDRVFTVKGQGTVITGSLSGGAVETDDKLVRMPSQESGRVRSIQQYHDSTDRAQSGSRVALNVPDWDHEEVTRGDIVTISGAGTVTGQCDGVIETPESPGAALEHDQQILAYLGTDRETVQVLLEDTRNEPRVARLNWLETDVFARPGDRLILRDFSDRHLLGCFTVLNVAPEESLHDDSYRDWLKSRRPVTPGTLLVSEVRRHGLVDHNNLAEGTPFSLEAFRTAAEASDGIATGDNQWFVDRNWLEAEESTIRSTVRAYHEDHPLRPGYPIRELDDRYESTAKRDVVVSLVTDDDLTLQEDCLRLASFSPEPTDRQAEQIAELLETLDDAGLETPEREELVDQFSEEVLRYLVRTDRIVQLSDERLVSSSVYERLLTTVREYLEENQPARLKDLRDLLDSSRKYVIPLMEYLDQQGVTIRDDDVRYLRTDNRTATGEVDSSRG